MKAAVINKYGGAEVFQYADLAMPQIKTNELLVKVQASSINPIDWKIRKGMLQLLTGYNFPLVLGFDVSGEVVEVGDSVTRFKVGDQIYTRLDNITGGAYAEYAAVSEKAACLKPETMTHEEAAAVPLAALTALQALRDEGQIRRGQSILINGASGGVGSYAVQIAKAFVTEVTGVCSTKNIELVKSLGADRVIDYTQQDFTIAPTKYDIIFDVVGNQSFWSCQNSLQPNGVYITTQPYPGDFVQSFLTQIVPGKTAKVILLQTNGLDLASLKELIEAGKVRSIIEQTYPLSEIATAHRESEKGHVVGKLVITVAS
ncbi:MULTISPECIES: NAD(P)-dependent alcohol dehydrogenase [unclassified Coleofasciculus]|uniref:NAD(P)-dependent alcohol dehydrogenase n=1 Tax=unclassified Coleofasciculus TaxID=2692782 RepID=UPI0018819C62|nr:MULTISPECIES: NAD(P)-dependent alcohol dehydrogenase [unclassified Coleofasciculus]MBE9129182.1 NAD(P)-dependent alcohol dehydrogenase [Coleofasciculus sp. LEGE 07081]MBE9151833.1 NAD(P)-dependent alcohol dehydrogenase [Coleofasciculus sp. LEGE 07092]